ncbi:MAG TPA: hypothetical protein VKD91_15225 [Pyrinomonadaceae bacterium]|nr:hypothetical protein [Pyrinomonadaceae bacterium]
MSRSNIYDERSVVLAYIDAQRPPYPHEDFRRFRRARLQALENAYGIDISMKGVIAQQARSLWMLFSATVNSYLSLKGPRDNFLEDSLINTTLDRLGAAGLELHEAEARFVVRLQECRAANLDFLTRLFLLLWGSIERPLSSADLLAFNFDDSKEPQLSDYYDEM